MTGLRGGCTGCRGADGALPKASKIQKERHLLSADVSLLRRDGQNRYFKISKRYRRPTPPAFWPAAHLRRTGALPQAKPRRRRNSFPPSIGITKGWSDQRERNPKENATCRYKSHFLLVEAGRVELPSENPSMGTSPGADGYCGSLALPVPVTLGKPSRPGVW